MTHRTTSNGPVSNISQPTNHSSFIAANSSSGPSLSTVGLLGNYNGVAAKVAKYALNSHYLKPVIPNSNSGNNTNSTQDSQTRVDAPKIIPSNQANSSQ